MLTTTEIQERLSSVEKDYNIKILYACESGSRAWNFNSKDSDYDIRFLYVRKPEDYLAVEPPRDVIEVAGDAVWDMNGWGLSKALKLLVKANTNLIEWIRSPIVYVENVELCAELLGLVHRMVSPEQLFYAYQGFARSHFKAYLQRDEVWLKKYLYVMRPLLSAYWIEKSGQLPPMVFDVMLSKAGEEHPYILEPMEKLLQQKRNGLERESAPRVAELDRFIDLMQGKSYEGIKLQKSVDWNQMNEVFRKYVLNF